MNIIGQKIISDGFILDTISGQKSQIPQTKVFAWSPHRQNIIALGIKNIVQLWTERKPNDWQLAVSFPIHQSNIKQVVWAPYDVTFASIDEDGIAYIHNKKQEKWDQPIQLTNDNYNTISFSPNKNTIAAAGQKIDIYENFRLVHQIQMIASFISYSINNRLLACNNTSINIFENTTLKQHISLNEIPLQIQWSLSGTSFFIQYENQVQTYNENVYNEFETK